MNKQKKSYKDILDKSEVLKTLGHISNEKSFASTEELANLCLIDNMFEYDKVDAQEWNDSVESMMYFFNDCIIVKHDKDYEDSTVLLIFSGDFLVLDVKNTGGSFEPRWHFNRYYQLSFN